MNVTFDRLKALIAEAMTRLGLPEGDAITVATVMAEADLQCRGAGTDARGRSGRRRTRHGEARLDQDFVAFVGRGGPSTAGNDFRYSAMAARSSGDNCEVFLITRAIEPPTLSPSGCCPVSSR